jgi:hypothetical protein
MNKDSPKKKMRRAWAHMISRCHNENDKSFKNYGARGIQVCERWRNSFDTFFTDVGMRPGTGYSLDRINNDGNYEPSNCRWATVEEQHRNTRETRLITAFGKTQCMADWAKEIGMEPTGLMRRLNCWSVEKALTTPVPRPEAKCLICEQPVIARARWQKFCSLRCKVRSRCETQKRKRLDGLRERVRGMVK